MESPASSPVVAYRVISDRWWSVYEKHQRAAKRAALIECFSMIESPTLLDLLALLSEQHFIVDTEEAGDDVRLGELLGLGEVGPTITEMLEHLDCQDWSDPLHSVRIDYPEILGMPLDLFMGESLTH